MQSLLPYLKPYDLAMYDWKKMYFNMEGHELSEHARLSTIKEYVGDSWYDFKKFTTVRNPISIVKSSYSYSKEVYEEHFRNKLDIPPDGSLKAFVYSEKTGYGPDGFVDFMLARNYDIVLPQAERLSLMLRDGLIMDLSTLSRDWDYITDWLGWDRKIPLLWENKSKSSAVEFSDDTVKRIKKHFEIDYDIIPKITGVEWN